MCFVTFMKGSCQELSRYPCFRGSLQVTYCHYLWSSAGRSSMLGCAIALKSPNSYIFTSGPLLNCLKLFVVDKPDLVSTVPGRLLKMFHHLVKIIFRKKGYHAQGTCLVLLGSCYVGTSGGQHFLESIPHWSKLIPFVSLC